MSQHSLKWALPELRSKSHLDGIHDPVGKDGHLARDSLHSLLELGDVWASGKDAVKAWRAPWGQDYEKQNRSRTSIGALTARVTRECCKRWGAVPLLSLPSPNRSAELMAVLPDMPSSRLFASYWHGETKVNDSHRHKSPSDILCFPLLQNISFQPPILVKVTCVHWLSSAHFCRYVQTRWEHRQLMAVFKLPPVTTGPTCISI